MSNPVNNRVLGRQGARELTHDEFDVVIGSGGAGTQITKDFTTTVCSIMRDGDCD